MADIKVRLGSENKIKVVPIFGKSVLKIGDLLDVDSTGVSDKYVLMYDAVSQKYKLVNPDEVLSASAVGETTQPGLPSDVLNVLDQELNNRVDLDGGEF